MICKKACRRPMAAPFLISDYRQLRIQVEMIAASTEHHSESHSPVEK